VFWKHALLLIIGDEKFKKWDMKFSCYLLRVVKGYLRGPKNDYNDAQTIAEAEQRGAIPPVAIKTVEQQDEQSILHMRRL